MPHLWLEVFGFALKPLLNDRGWRLSIDFFISVVFNSFEYEFMMVVIYDNM